MMSFMTSSTMSSSATSAESPTVGFPASRLLSDGDEQELMLLLALFLVAMSAARQTPLTRPRLVLFDVMDTLVVDPFFKGMHKAVFGCDSMQELFSLKDQRAFVDFETGAITEEECTSRYFLDRRPVDGVLVREYLRSGYAWVAGMRELCEDLQQLGVPMALCSNYPQPWAALVEETVGLSQYAAWAAVSGATGHRKPAPQAYEAALAAVGRPAADVVFVDDSKNNCVAARELGIESILFESAAALRAELRARYFPELPA
jgi:putative hydrolase of the HAD superfamily